MNDASTYSSDLKGSYQQKNIRTVISTLRMLQKRGWNISEENIQKGLMNTVKNTGLMGRWQILGQAPKVICDTAHNREGLQIVLDQLASEDFQNLHIAPFSERCYLLFLQTEYPPRFGCFPFTISGKGFWVDWPGIYFCIKSLRSCFKSRTASGLSVCRRKYFCGGRSFVIFFK